MTRERIEAIEEAREKEAWTKFNYKKSGFRKRKENGNIPEVIQRAKKPRIDQEHTEVTGLGDWLLMMEEICLRAGKLRESLEKDKQ